MRTRVRVAADMRRVVRARVEHAARFLQEQGSLAGLDWKHVIRLGSVPGKHMVLCADHIRLFYIRYKMSTS
jgi:hypothetical protein